MVPVTTLAASTGTATAAAHLGWFLTPAKTLRPNGL